MYATHKNIPSEHYCGYLSLLVMTFFIKLTRPAIYPKEFPKWNNFSGKNFVMFFILIKGNL